MLLLKQLVPFIIQVSLTVTSTSFTSAFSPCSTTATTTTTRTSTTCSTTSSALYAKKPKRSSKSKSPTKSGGGFGSTSSSSSSSSTSPKTRTVSGYTGSGTKPLRNAANTFDKIRKTYGKEGTTDLYIKSPLNDPLVCWHVGKVCRRLNLNDTDMRGTTLPTEMEAVISQKRLILEYSKNQLRPQNLSGPYSNNLELWIAPGDTEMDAVQNKVSFVKVTGSTSDLSEGFNVNDVGFNPEIYVGEEQKEGGLRVKRDENGDPVKAVFEING